MFLPIGKYMLYMPVNKLAVFCWLKMWFVGSDHKEEMVGAHS